MYAIKLREGVYHQVAGWVTDKYVTLSQATLYTAKEQAQETIKRHKLNYGNFPKIVSVSV